MKKIYLLLFFVIFILTSCSKPVIWFATPQPKDVNQKNQIDNNLIGDYRCIDTSIVLIDFDQTYPFKKDSAMKLNIVNLLKIRQREIINTLEGDLFIMKSSLDSADKFKLLYLHDFDSTIIHNMLNPVYSYTLDSIDKWYKIHLNISSTVFKISENNVYKEFKEKYYFNRMGKLNIFWDCTQFDFNKELKTLSINSLSQDDVTLIERLTKLRNESDTINKNINPSKRTFKKFLRMKGFEDKIIMKKL